MDNRQEGVGKQPKVTTATATKWSRNNDEDEYDVGDVEAAVIAPWQHPVVRHPTLLLLPSGGGDGVTAHPRLHGCGQLE
jgi:hypothetical protein